MVSTRRVLTPRGDLQGLRVLPGDYVRIEVHDAGGPWNEQAYGDGRPHGLSVVRELAAAWGRHGDGLTGWTVWACLSWLAPQQAGRQHPSP